MDAILELFDTNAKRWLGVLVASVLVSVVVLERSFMNALSPPENTVTVQSSTSGGTEEAQSQSEPSRDNQPQAQAQEENLTVNQVSPFDNVRRTAPKTDPAVRQQLAHQQADYLRQLIAAGKLPKGFGNLTKEQVDEMEKKGITID